jgi:hypothetical protein
MYAMSMMRRAIAVIVFFALCCPAWSADAFSPHDAEEDANAATTWAAQQYEAVVEELLGDPASSGFLQLDTLWIITFRVIPAYSQPEVQVVLTKSTTGEVTAVVSKLRRSLELQLQDLYRDNQARTPSEIAKLVQVDRVTLSQADCPALKKIAMEFERVRAHVVLRNALVLDPRQYQLWVNAGPQQEYSSLLGPANGKGRHPIIVWIEESMKRIEGKRTGCLRSSRGQ